MDKDDFEGEAAPPRVSTEQQAGNILQRDLHPQGRQPTSPRTRVIRIGLGVVALVAIVAVLGVPLVTRQARVVSTPPQPVTPQPTVPPQNVLLRSTINFGTVTINGTPQPGTLPMFFPVRPTATGTPYTITITAPPFSPVSCSINFSTKHLEIDSNGLCTADSVHGSLETTANGVTAIPDFQVDLIFTPENLPADQQKQINTLLQPLAFQQTITVPAGSYVATSYHPDYTITSQLTTESLQATAFLTTSTNFQLFSGPCPGLVCPGDPGAQFPKGSKAWWVGVPAALRWQFTTAEGHLLGNASFPAGASVPAVLVYETNTGWSLAPSSAAEPPASPGALSYLDCQTGMLLLQQVLHPTAMSTFRGHRPGITGCGATIEDGHGKTLGAFIWRFGVLMAADEGARQLLPDLPIAPQA